MSVDEQFNRLNEKLQLLLKQHSRLKKEVEKLRSELEEQKKENADTQALHDELKQQMSIQKLGAGELNDQDRKEFEKKINQYLKEIDRCIDFLRSE